MENVNRNVMATTLTTVSSLNGTSTSFNDVPKASYYLQRSAIIKGNRKSPNPWRYTISQNTPNLSSWYKTVNYDRNTPPFTETTISGYYRLSQPSIDYSYYSALAREDAIADLYDKLRGSLDLSVDAFQAKQTARMFKLTDTLCQSYKAFFQKNRRFAGTKQFGALWLTYVYGVRPLMSSIYGTTEELIRYSHTRNKIYTGFGKRTANIIVPMTIATAAGSRTLDFKVNVVAKHRITASYNVDSPRIDRFTSLNPVSIAYELIPYSFVVDWFYNLGGYIRDFETSVLYASQFRNGYETVVKGARWEAKGAFALSTYDPSGNPINVADFTNCKGRYIDYSRGILFSTPVPRPPTLKVDLGSSRLLNAAALLSQFLVRK